MNNYVLNQKIRHLENLLLKSKTFAGSNQTEMCYYCSLAITALMSGENMTDSDLYKQDEYLEWIESFYEEFYKLLIINNFQDLKSQLDEKYVWVRVE